MDIFTSVADDAHNPNKASFVQRMMGARLPAWLLLVAVLVVSAAWGAVVIQQRSNTVDLGDAVAEAQTIDVNLTLCNRAVDRREINPRQAELDLQEVLQDEGAAEASVTVEREDCPEDEEGGTGQQ